MKDFLTDIDRHILARAHTIPKMISDPVERENVQILYDLLQLHVEQLKVVTAELEKIKQEVDHEQR